MEYLIMMGVPTALTGFLFWLLQRWITKSEEERKRHEANIETLMMYQIKLNRATNILAEATAKAVQRIPDAHCNGDMSSALEKAQKIEDEEKEFLFKQGVEALF